MNIKSIAMKLIKGFVHPNLALSLVLEKFGVFIPDRKYLVFQYRLRTGLKLNLDNPVTFNEKLQWLKLYNRKPEYTKMADKYEARKYVSRKIGEEYLIPLLGVWNKFDEIDFEKLPNQFVLKATHDSGGLVICKDKNEFSIKQAQKVIEKHLRQNYYYGGREWVYRDIQPRIVVEKYMTDESGTELKDYKIFCFDGIPKIIQVDFNRFTGHKRNFYSTKWEYQPFSLLHKTYPDIDIAKPKSLDKLLEIAGILSEGIPYLRVDLYLINDGIYFGEMTFYPEDGYGLFTPHKWDKIFGNWIILPEKNFQSTGLL